MAKAESPDAPARADARRNYDQLLAAARETIAEQGTEASLRAVARRAGVGIGTLYRHFPDREALLRALLGRGFDTLCARAAELLSDADADAALVTWVRELAEAWTLYDGLPASVMGALRDPDSRLHRPCEDLRARAGALLRRAQGTGSVRPDLTVDELLATVNAMAWAAKQAPGQSTDRFLSLLVDGLAAR
jgi:AcrR family transcriptional regulator